MKKRIALLATLFLLFVSFATDFEPRPPANFYVGVDGASNMHGDVGSSDTTALPGPGINDIDHKHRFFTAACPTLLIRTDGHPFALCTAIFGRNLVLRMLNKDNGKKMAKLELTSASLLGGVYAYIDNQDRLVMVDGGHNIIRVKAEYVKKLVLWEWRLSIDDTVSIADAVVGHCGGGNCDSTTSIMAGDDGSVWFATKQSVVGFYDPSTGVTNAIQLGDGSEQVHNSLSTAPGGRVSVMTDHALYLLTKGENGTPQVEWRTEYDRGTHRKPGQLSHGSGASPTFFGPETGTEYLTISDNAEPLISVLVIDASVNTPAEGGRGGQVICKNEVFAEGSSGTENSLIGIGRSMFIASSYGYPYPAEPQGVAAAVPSEADFVGGMARIDIRHDESGCDLVWENTVRSSAVPKLSTTDELIYTVERVDSNGDFSTGLLDTFHFTVVDPYTGVVLKQHKIGGGFFRDTLEMVGNTGFDNVLWLGDVSGVTRIAPKN